MLRVVGESDWLDRSPVVFWPALPVSLGANYRRRMTVQHMPSETRPTGDRYDGPKTCPACDAVLGPGRVLVGWQPCTECEGGRANRNGHTIYRCLYCDAAGERTICYYPPHTPART